jgi:hypothetical protein
MLGGTPKSGQKCIIVFPKIFPHDMAKAYVMTYDDDKEISCTEVDEMTPTLGIEEDK